MKIVEKSAEYFLNSTINKSDWFLFPLESSRLIKVNKKEKKIPFSSRGNLMCSIDQIHFRRASKQNAA